MLARIFLSWLQEKNRVEEKSKSFFPAKWNKRNEIGSPYTNEKKAVKDLEVGHRGYGYFVSNSW